MSVNACYTSTTQDLTSKNLHLGNHLAPRHWCERCSVLFESHWLHVLVISWKVAALVVGQVVLVPGFLRGEEQLVTLRQAPDVPLFEFTRSMPVSREGLAVYEGLVVCLMFHVTTVMHQRSAFPSSSTRTHPCDHDDKRQHCGAGLLG